MKIQVNDGVVQFATHFVATQIPDIDVRPLRRFHVDPDGITCYSDKEKDQAEAALKSLGLSFVTETLNHPKEHKDKTEGLKYGSRTEAIKHINGEIEMPDSEIIPYLKKERNNLRIQLDQVIVEKEELKIKNKQVGDALLQMMFKK